MGDFDFYSWSFTIMAVEGATGSVSDPIVLSPDELDSDIDSFVSRYGYVNDGSYFAVDYGAYVNFYSLPGDGSSVSINSGSLSSSDDDPSYGSRVYGTATDDFYLLFIYSGNYFNWHFIVSDPLVEFTSTDSVPGISGDPISYTATTNVVSTFAELGGTAASWLDIDPTTGQVTGTLPTVDSVTTYTYEIQAASVDDQSKTATLTLTITVIPALEFLSDPVTDGVSHATD